MCICRTYFTVLDMIQYRQYQPEPQMYQKRNLIFLWKKDSILSEYFVFNSHDKINVIFLKMKVRWEPMSVIALLFDLLSSFSIGYKSNVFSFPSCISFHNHVVVMEYDNHLVSTK